MPTTFPIPAPFADHIPFLLKIFEHSAQEIEQIPDMHPLCIASPAAVSSTLKAKVQPTREILFAEGKSSTMKEFLQPITYIK